MQMIWQALQFRLQQRETGEVHPVAGRHDSSHDRRKALATFYGFDGIKATGEGQIPRLHRHFEAGVDLSDHQGDQVILHNLLDRHRFDFHTVTHVKLLDESLEWARFRRGTQNQRGFRGIIAVASHLGLDQRTRCFTHFRDPHSPQRLKGAEVKFCLSSSAWPQA